MMTTLREARSTDHAAMMTIARDLPEYFNTAGLAQLKKDIADHPAQVVLENDNLVAFAVIHKQPDQVCEILWMAVDKAHQNRGLGTLLVHHIVYTVTYEHVRLLKVKTLAPSVDYAPYEGTRRFYERLGFLPFEDLDPYEPWGEGNPCRIYAKPLYYLTVGNPVDPSLTPGHTISLREITDEMVRAVCNLSVHDHQHRFVAHNAVSLAQAAQCPEAWYRAVYADETPVGFVMVHDNTAKAEYYLWRFMIDGRYQGFGFGRQALDLVIDYVKTRPGAEELLTSVVQAPYGPQPFYEARGFVATGNYDEAGEAELRLTLD